MEEYVSALRIELDGFASNSSRQSLEDRGLRDEAAGGPRVHLNAALDTVYLGGGTPSRLGGTGVADVLSALRERAGINPTAEITIEANPDDVTPDAATAWVRAGVNRISLGAQSFDDGALKWMHRSHDARQIALAIETLREAGITNISLDLIFALPAHLNRSWKRDVDHALQLDPDHVSLYGLTLEPHTPLARWADRGTVVEGTEIEYEEEFLHAHETMSAAGFEHYEVSNFSRPGRASRHNSAYWSGAAYAGIGPSAHSFDGVSRRWNVSAYADWAKRLARRETVIAGEELLTAENRQAEEVYLGLRTRRGLRLDEIEKADVELWIDAGWAELDRESLRLTATGWLRLDSLAADLTARRGNRAASALSATPSHCYI